MLTSDDWPDFDPYEGADRITMEIDAPEKFEHPCGFVRLKERLRVKAPSRRIEPKD